MRRNIEQHLLDWKGEAYPKPLLLRGARQVGKTYSVRKLGATFSSYLEVNFLEQPELARFFQSGSLEPMRIKEKLETYFGKSISIGNTLLFFDEAQACPEALSSLRFFYEKVPGLHIVAAGSLLEFTLAEIPSFGVGRTQSLFLYPVSVGEFFVASGNARLLDRINEAFVSESLDPVLHKKAVDLLRTYSMIGGFPEVVSTYLESHDLLRCMAVLESLVLSYEDDFAKYKKRANVLKLRDVLRSVARQAGHKFVFSHVNPGGSTFGYDTALELLRLAGLVYRVQHSSGNGMPLGAETNHAKFKIIPADVGMYNRLCGLDLSKLVLADDMAWVHSGALAEVLVGTELVAGTPASQRAELYYWSREARGSNAEVDYLIAQDSTIYPIEVKAGTKGQMQSLYRFIAEKKLSCGIRASLENFSSFRGPGGELVRVLPIYAMSSFCNCSPLIA